MTRRLLVVLDPDPHTAVATRYAIEIARRWDGEVTGLALVDLKETERDAAGAGIGAMYYAEHLRRARTENFRTVAQGLLGRFVAEVEAGGVRHTEDHVAEGDVVRIVEEDLLTHDLLVGGREVRFDYADPGHPSRAMEVVAREGAAAVLLVGAEHRPIRRVLVAYDGRLTAARTLQAFAHLRPFGTDLEVELVHVRAHSARRGLEEGAAVRRLEGARAYLAAHGFHAAAPRIVAGQHPAEVLVHLVKASNADLLVAGMPAEDGVRRLLSGSTVRRLLQQCPVAVFLAH
jgi:nucleotide-binding universal stress UspA family protein